MILGDKAVKTMLSLIFAASESFASQVNYYLYSGHPAIVFRRPDFCGHTLCQTHRFDGSRVRNTGLTHFQTVDLTKLFVR